MSRGVAPTFNGASDSAEQVTKVAAQQDKGALSDEESAIKRRRGWLELAKLARRHSSVPSEADKGMSPGLVQR